MSLVASLATAPITCCILLQMEKLLCKQAQWEQCKTANTVMNPMTNPIGEPTLQGARSTKSDSCKFHICINNHKYAKLWGTLNRRPLNHLYALGHVPSYSKSMMFSLPPSFNIIQSLWCSPSLPLWTSKTFTHETSQQFKVYDVLPPSLFEHQRHSRMKHHSNSKSMMFSLPPSLNIKDIHAWNITEIQSPWCSPSLPLWTSKTFTHETSQ